MTNGNVITNYKGRHRFIGFHVLIVPLLVKLLSVSALKLISNLCAAIVLICIIIVLFVSNLLKALNIPVPISYYGSSAFFG